MEIPKVLSKKGDDFLKKQVFHKTYYVLQNRLCSFYQPLLETSVMNCFFGLIQKPTHILPENLLQRTKSFTSGYLVNHLT